MKAKKEKIFKRLAFHTIMLQTLKMLTLVLMSICLYSCTKKTPELQTTDITGITSVSGTGGGSVTDEGTGTISEFGICWSKKDNPEITDYRTTETGSFDNFSSTMSQLSASTKYYVRAYAVSSDGIGYGNTVSFVTSGPGHIVTSAISIISRLLVTGGGEVVSDGGFPVTARGICWSSQHTPTVDDNKSVNGSGIGVFTSNLGGLQINLPYRVRAYAINSEGIFYGNEVVVKIPLAAIWEKGQSFSRNTIPNDFIMTDSLNIWMKTMAVPDMYPLPDEPVRIFKSSNGGSTWNVTSIPSTNKLFALPLSAIDGNTAWVSIESKGLYRTTDGGSSWNIINNGVYFMSHRVFVHFFDSNEGIGRFSTPDSTAIIKTRDGGLTWEEIPYSRIAGIKLPEEMTYYMCKSPVQAIGDTVFITTDLARLYISYDRGDNWKIITYGQVPYEQFMNLALITSKKFALVSRGTYVPGSPYVSEYNYPKIIATEDGGDSWLTPVTLSSIQLGYISSIPHNGHTYVVSCYRIDKPGGTFISNNGGRSFVSADSLLTNIGPTIFYSKHHAFGASYCGNEPSGTENNIYKLNPEGLFYKKIW